MIRETHIDKNMNRLLNHFGARVVGRPPATAANLAALEAVVGPLPRDLTLFLATSDGLRVELTEPWPFAHLLSTHEMLLPLPFPGVPGMPQGFLPIAGSAEAPRDWIVLLPGNCHGAVVRCDPWAGENSLVASCFGPYLESWTNHLIKHFDTQGRPTQGVTPDHFNGAHIARHDVKLRQLQKDAYVQSLLGELNLAFACGADFE